MLPEFVRTSNGWKLIPSGSAVLGGIVIFLSVAFAPNSVYAEEAENGMQTRAVAEQHVPASQKPLLKPLSGSMVYKRICMACHTLSVWGAPKLGDRLAWQGRVDKGKNALYSSVLNGFNKMPVRGYCQFCTDEELKSAVDYMIKKARPQKRVQP